MEKDDKTLTTFIKQSIQQKGKRRNKEREPMSQPEELNPKRVRLRGKATKSHPRIRTKRSLLFPVRGRI